MLVSAVFAWIYFKIDENSYLRIGVKASDFTVALEICLGVLCKSGNFFFCTTENLDISYSYIEIYDSHLDLFIYLFKILLLHDLHVYNVCLIIC